MHCKVSENSWYSQALYPSDNTYVKLQKLKWTFMNFHHVFIWYSPRFFVPLQNISRNVLLVKTILITFESLVSNGTISSIFGPYGARPTVFPQHSATFGLAQIQESVARISRTFGFGTAAQTNVPAMRGQHYLPTLRASLKCPIFMAFWALRVYSE